MSESTNDDFLIYRGAIGHTNGNRYFATRSITGGILDKNGKINLGFGDEISDVGWFKTEREVIQIIKKHYPGVLIHR